eukprot:NODE_1469_length_994_cov_0.446927.p1 type:complete len:157 gc:universal NODE_1469_length_994_cov_0.446927:538-68(-)
MSQRLFAKFIIPDYEVFFENNLIYAMVNTKPVVPGHVLLVPKRVVPRYYDLTDEETNEIAVQSKIIGRVVEKLFDATSLTFVCQDGKDSGQSVPHVHLHILPRKPNDFSRNDDIYDVLEKRARIDVDEMPPRSADEMHKESTLIREALESWTKNSK